MTFGYSEDEVHEYMYKHGIEALVVDSAELTRELAEDAGPCPSDDGDWEEAGFELWKIIKKRVLERIDRIHSSVRYGTFIGSKVKLPTDSTRAMELDLLGEHEDGLFILELKVERSSERNAFSELLAYSNYIAQMFAMSGPQDITNVLVAPMNAKITRHAFLYDLLIANRNVLVYEPVLTDGTLQSLELQVHVPSDEDFRYFASRLLSHDAMACVVASFHDLDQWYDSREENGGVNDHTKAHLEGLSSYAAQLMEAEQLHGFAFIRKPWQELPRFYRNSLVVCAINPFFVADAERADPVIEQLTEEHRESFSEMPRLAFDGRLLRLAARAVEDCLEHGKTCELETPLWAAMVHSPVEVVYTHNFGFRPTGIMREAYVHFLNQLYDQQEAGEDIDLYRVKTFEIKNWLRAWMFMEMCGFRDGDNGSNQVGDDESIVDLDEPKNAPPSASGSSIEDQF